MSSPPRICHPRGGGDPVRGRLRWGSSLDSRLRGNDNPPGFTLVELLVAMALVGLLMGLVIGQVGKIFQRELRQSATRMGATIRYLYNKSVSEGVTLRLVMDLDEHRYWVEGASEAVTIRREEEETSREPDKKDSEKEPADLLRPKEPSFSPQESALLKASKLPKGVFFKDVYAEHQLGPVSAGKAFLYFFPQGYAERGVIHLRNAKDDVHYSLEINPVMGDVKIGKGYKEVTMEAE